MIEEEDSAIDIADEGEDDVRKKGDLYLIGKIWVDCTIRRGLLESMMSKVWHLSAKVRFKEVGSNKFIISFAMHINKYCVEVGKP